MREGDAEDEAAHPSRLLLVLKLLLALLALGPSGTSVPVPASVGNPARWPTNGRCMRMCNPPGSGQRGNGALRVFGLEVFLDLLGGLDVHRTLRRGQRLPPLPEQHRHGGVRPEGRRACWLVGGRSTQGSPRRGHGQQPGAHEASALLPVALVTCSTHSSGLAAAILGPACQGLCKALMCLLVISCAEHSDQQNSFDHGHDGRNGDGVGESAGECREHARWGWGWEHRMMARGKAGPQMLGASLQLRCGARC